MASDQITRPRVSSVAVVVPKPDFDPDQSAYQCCCGCCHVTFGLQLIALFEMIFLAFQLVATSVVYAETSGGNHSTKATVEEGTIIFYVYSIFEQNAEVTLAAAVFTAAIGFGVIFLMLFGVKKDKPSFLLPHMISQCLAVIALLVAGALVVYGAVTIADRVGTVDKNVQWTALMVLLTFLALYLISVGIVVYFIFVVYRGYRFLKARLHYEESAAAYAFYYSNQNRQPSMAPSLTVLYPLPFGSISPRGSYSHLAVENTPRGSYSHLAGGSTPRGSCQYLAVQNPF